MRQETLPLFGPEPPGDGRDAPSWEEEWAGLAPAAARPASDEPSREDALGRFADLEALAAEARSCRACGLRDGCRGVVFGEGDPRARVVVVGEGPGATEDVLGRPFVGRAGELLDRILLAAGFRRQEVYITNVVMCRPPGNRVPTDREVAACLPFLRAKLRLIRPAIVVCLGSTAARALLHPRARITQVRGRWHRGDGYLIMPTYHPAALLRDESKKRPVWEDFKRIRDAHRRLAEAGPSGFAALAEALCGDPAPAGGTRSGSTTAEGTRPGLSRAEGTRPDPGPSR